MLRSRVTLGAGVVDTAFDFVAVALSLVVDAPYWRALLPSIVRLGSSVASGRAFLALGPEFSDPPLGWMHDCLFPPGSTHCLRSAGQQVAHLNGFARCFAHSSRKRSPRTGEAWKVRHRHRRFLCDRSVPAKERMARIGQTVVASAVYGAGLWPPSSELKRRLDES